jgi:hypothetical protein
MGLFDIFKKKQQPKETSESNVLLAMPMFINGDRYNLKDVVENLKSYWELSISHVEGEDETAVLTIGGETVAIGYMSVPIPMGDIEGTARYAYNWPTVLDDLKGFSGHAIVSVMSAKKTTVERYKLLSKVLHAILSTTNSVGIYQGSQSLLIPKAHYIDTAEDLKSDGLPISLWIYIGLRQSETGNSVYTYGLTRFGKNELEVINSKLSLEEICNFVVNICSYIIGNDISFKSGETLGYTADTKIKISMSRGEFVEGQSLKLEM